MTLNRLLSVVMLVSTALLVACANNGSDANTDLPARPPSEGYLAIPVQAGWQRVVGVQDGLVLVLETPKSIAASDEFPYRMVLFNERPQDISWDDHFFGLILGDGPEIGFPVSALGRESEPLRLASNESTTFGNSIQLGRHPGTYEITGAVRAHSRGANAVATEPARVVSY